MKWWGSDKDRKNERVYLDWASATPLLPEAKVAMEPFLGSDFGNASSIHKEGQVARETVEGARDRVARALQTRSEYVTFTAGGTEANNLAILGTVNYLHHNERNYSEMEIVTTRIEHPSVSRVVEYLSGLGVLVKYVDVDEEGFVILAHLRELLSESTVLFSVAYANSEIGVVQKLHRLKKVLREAEERFGSKIMFHLDGAQAPLWLNCQMDSAGADLLSLDSGKFCGPKGVGLLVSSKRAKVENVIYGGGQEAGLRPGTENVAGIVGAGTAMADAQANWRERAQIARAVRDEGIKILLKDIPEAILNGPSGEYRLANNINISIPYLDTEYATVWLDSKGFSVSTKSACSGAGGGESVVVKVVSNNSVRASSTLRFTIGPDTSISQLQKLANNLRKFIDKTTNL